MVWLSGKDLHPITQIAGLNESVELTLECDLIDRCGRSEGNRGAENASDRTRDEEDYFGCRLTKHSPLHTRSAFGCRGEQEKSIALGCAACADSYECFNVSSSSVFD
jgi:hypothetical protein